HKDSQKRTVSDLEHYPFMEPEITDVVLLFQTVIQWIAIILSASTGVYDARKNGMDFFGALVIAVIVAVGGGTIRDLLLDRYPLFWLADPIYLISIFIVGIIGILLIPISHPDEPEVKSNTPGFFHPIISFIFGTSDTFAFIDSFALGMWAYLGSMYALSSGIPPIIAPIMGVITASFGGVLRDILFAKIPELFKPSQFYAIASCAGATMYVIMSVLGFSGTTGFMVCMIVTVFVRMTSIQYNITSF
ncbi:MAG TPA: TRIC cation channel family protein, partial [Methanospirillum sp.]|nr:TRIC cation channel family protein [Methanospirillum sp.]